jgi:hypothetical protein
MMGLINPKTMGLINPKRPEDRHHFFFTGQSTTFSRSLTGQSSGKGENDETCF